MTAELYCFASMHCLSSYAVNTTLVVVCLILLSLLRNNRIYYNFNLKVVISLLGPPCYLNDEGS